MESIERKEMDEMAISLLVEINWEILTNAAACALKTGHYSFFNLIEKVYLALRVYS